MRALLVVAALALTPAMAWAQGGGSGKSCQQLCTDHMSRCVTGCSDALKCQKKCAGQYDDCAQGCVKSGKMEKPSGNEMCPDATGKMIRCSEYEAQMKKANEAPTPTPTRTRAKAADQQPSRTAPK